MVARSDYCDYPPEARLPRVGTNLTPNYEAIARLKPTLILGQGDYGSRRPSSKRSVRTVLLPWLSLDEVSRGIEELGRLTGQPPAAALADELAELGVPSRRTDRGCCS